MAINSFNLINELLLHTTANQLPEALIILDEKFKVFLLNEEAEKLFDCLFIDEKGKLFSNFCQDANIPHFISDYIQNPTKDSSNKINTVIHHLDLVWQVFFIQASEGLFHVLKTTNFSEKKNKNIILETLIDHMPCNVYWMDKNCLMLGCNQNVLNMLNMTIEEFRGKSYEELSVLCNWPEGLAAKLKNDDLTVLRTGQGIYGVEDPPIPHANNTFLNLLTSRVPLRNKNGELIGVAGISAEITALKEAWTEREKLEAVNRAKSEFIANMSHDFVTPLTGIINMSADLKEEQSAAHNQKRAHWLYESGKQLLELCTEILQSVSADNYTEQDLKEECFNLRQFIKSIAQLETPMIQSKGLELKIDIDKATPSYLVTDRVKLYRILLNLLGNAIKFTHTGHITIKIELLEKTDTHAKLNISVIDSGRGIAPDMQKKIFERFFRVNPSYKAIDKGYGIGLHIAQKYVRLLGGAEGIQLESKKGKGSRFYFNLSFKIGSKQEVMEATSQSNYVTEKTNPLLKKQDSFSFQQNYVENNSPLLLLIEDSPPALLGLESLIKKVGCRFKSATSGKQSLELAKNNDFDLIITDIGLPDISGIEVTKQVRNWEKEQGKTKNVPIIALTAHATQMTEPECLQAGINRVLTKPAHFSMVKNLIEQFVSKNEAIHF